MPQLHSRYVQANSSYQANNYESTDGKTYHYFPWSTPIKEYKDINGIKIPSFALTIFHKPEGDFCYGEFKLKEIEFNCRKYNKQA
jgi:Family of unknown function (DUF6544)